MPKKPGPPSSFKPAYSEEIVKYLAQGHTIAAFAGHIGVGLRTLYDWAGRHEDFAKAKEIAELKSLGFWEDKAIAAAKGENKAAPAVLIFGLKNRGKEHWRDVQSLEHTGKDGGAIKTQEVSSREKLFDLVSRVSQRERATEDNSPKPH